jgi:hypothetical protein
VTSATLSRRRERGGVHTRAQRVNYRRSEGGEEDRYPSACAIDADNRASAVACALARTTHIAARHRNSTTELTEWPEGRSGIISAMAATCAARDKDRILSRQQQIPAGEPSTVIKPCPKVQRRAREPVEPGVGGSGRAREKEDRWKRPGTPGMGKTEISTR